MAGLYLPNAGQGSHVKKHNFSLINQHMENKPQVVNPALGSVQLVQL